MLKRFYATLFGWQMRETPIPSYQVVGAGTDGIAGGIGPSWDGTAGRVTFYVEVADVREALSDVEDLGGTIIRRPQELPQMGLTFAVFTDPDGHVGGLQQRR